MFWPIFEDSKNDAAGLYVSTSISKDVKKTCEKKWFWTLFTKKCLMLHCNAEMKVTNEKKGTFSFYSHNMNKKFQ